MGSNIETTNPRQSRRVAAWIYTVINPILESLEREAALLEKGNLTWRSSTNRCEYIRNIQEYVDSRQWPNYKDFLIENDDFSKGFGAHDTKLEKVNSEGEKLYKWLLSWDEFASGVSVSLERYEGHRSVEPAWPSYNLVRKELERVAAENLINNVQSLPGHYTYSFFWNFVASEQLGLRRHSQFSSLFETQGELRKISSTLKATLEEHRLSLSRKHDVPAAPVPGLPIDY